MSVLPPVLALRLPLFRIFLLALICAGRVGAQTPAPVKEPASLEEIMRQPHTGAPTDKIAPTMGGLPAYDAHTQMLRRLYPEELMEPLSDHFDRTVPGGFPAALAHARDAGLPDAMLAEIEVSRAMFDVNFPTLIAAGRRMEAARPNWQESASLFPTQREFDLFLAMVRSTVAQERAKPGSFAQTAMRLRKRDIARAVYNDLRQVDGCSDQYAILHNTRMGQLIPVEGWMAYVNPKSHLAVNKGADVTGQPFGPQRAGDMPAVPEATYRAVADAVPDDFWKPYRVPTVATAQR